MPNISQTPYRGTGQVYNYKTIERNSRDEARKVLPHVRTKGTAIDVGAHVGTWAIHLAHVFKRVICIEPVIEMKGAGWTVDTFNGNSSQTTLTIAINACPTETVSDAEMTGFYCTASHQMLVGLKLTARP